MGYVEHKPRARHAQLSLVGRPFGEFGHYVVQIEATRFLAWWKFLEALQPFGDIRLCPSHDKQVIEPPLFVAYSFVVGNLEWIRAQVEELW